MKTKTHNIFKKLFIVFSVLAFVFGWAISAIAEPETVAVLPFKINAEKDLSFLQNGIVDMLSSRLSWEDKVTVFSKENTLAVLESVAGTLNEPTARKIGIDLKADYVLFGSLTVFGSSVSIDAKMVDVAGAKPTLTFFNQSQGMDEVIPKIDLFATDINEKVFGRQIIARQLPEQKPPETPIIYAHPERQFVEGQFEEGSTPGGSSPFVMTRAADETSGFWKSMNFKAQLKGLALGDVDGDGKIETVLISSQQILIYRSENGRFLKLKEISGERQQQFVGVDVADIKPNGRAEIFVTCFNVNAKTLDSFVLEWNGKDFAPLVKGENWYYRTLIHPKQEPLLLGQKKGVSELFLPHVYALSWNGESYVSNNKVSLPKDATVYGVAMGDVMNNGQEMVVMFDDDDYLRITTPSGEKEWKSEDQYGGSENFLAISAGGVEGLDGEKDGEKRIYLPQRIFITDFNQGGKNQVLVIKNHAFTGRFFRRYRRYSGAQFESLSWNGLGLAQEWHTRKVSGYCSDYAIGDFDNDSKPELVAVIVSQRGSVVEKAKSSVIAYNLEAPAGQK